MNRIRISLCLVALAFAGACELVQEPPPRPSSRIAATEFLHAWDEGDYVTMSEMTSPPVPPARIERWVERAARSGAITDVGVELTGDVQEFTREDLEEDRNLSTTAPFTITYTSDAADAPVTFEGELGLTLDPGSTEEEGDESWVTRWERADLWPGIEDAHSFAVTYRWLKRGSILDRDGRPLAVGRAEKRRYPQGTLAGTTIGHIEPFEQPKGKGRDGQGAEDEPAQDESAQDESGEGAPVATPGDLVGGSGLELGLQERLAGAPSSRLLVVDAAGETLEVVGRARGSAGRDVKTTLDVEVQRAAENAYGGTTGGAVVMDPSTGGLLAVVASSAFGPQNYVGVPDIEPFNRALSGLYPPGSSLKVMTAAAALEEGVVKEGTRLSGPPEYRGVRNFESGAFGTLDFATAVKFSVNTAFAQIAEDLGARRLKRYADSFGFNRPPDMPLGAATSSFPFPEDEGDVMWSSIGQAQVLATPLQMATVAATIANNGKRREPRILLRGPKTGERVVSRKVAATMTRLMENVVNGGTGTGARISGAQVAGKTGTAEVDVDGKRMNHAWFIAFAPSRSPKVAVAVVSELGGVGGQVAAPIAGRILSSVLPLVR